MLSEPWAFRPRGTDALSRFQVFPEPRGSRLRGVGAPHQEPAVEADWKTGAGVEAWLKRELGGGLRTWEAIFDQYGYIPTGLGTQSMLPGSKWDECSDTGGYAHLISASAEWLLVLEGKRDWELHNLPRP